MANSLFSTNLCHTRNEFALISAAFGAPRFVDSFFSLPGYRRPDARAAIADDAFGLKTLKFLLSHFGLRGSLSRLSMCARRRLRWSLFFFSFHKTEWNKKNVEYYATRPLREVRKQVFRVSCLCAASLYTFVSLHYGFSLLLYILSRSCLTLNSIIYLAGALVITRQSSIPQQWKQ